MSEYIKREDAIKAFEQWKEPQVLNEQDDVWNRGIDCCINEVKHHVPSADVVEVVRCKDCKYYVPISEKIGECKDTRMNSTYMSYCSCGERKDGESK